MAPGLRESVRTVLQGLLDDIDAGRIHPTDVIVYLFTEEGRDQFAAQADSGIDPVRYAGLHTLGWQLHADKVAKAAAPVLKIVKGDS